MTKESKNNPNKHFDGGVGAVAPILKGTHNPINKLQQQQQLTSKFQSHRRLKSTCSFVDWKGGFLGL